MLRVAFAAACAASLWLLSGAQVEAASVLTKIDCSETEFEIDAAGVDVTCMAGDEATHFASEGKGPGEVRIEVINIKSPTDDTIIRVYSYRLLASHYGFKRGSLRETFKSAFPIADPRDWKSTGARAGYEDSAEYRGSQNDPNDTCLAVMRYANKRWGVYKRYVVGAGCSSKGSEVVAQVLEKLDAPGE